jgi:hypothetical protein
MSDPLIAMLSLNIIIKNSSINQTYGSDGHGKPDAGVGDGFGNGQGSQSGVGVEGVEIAALPIFINSETLN